MKNMFSQHHPKRTSLLQLVHKFDVEIRFLTVGAIVFTFDATMFYLLLSFTPLQLVSARALAFSAAVVFSWYMNRNWTFKSRKHSAKMKQFCMSLVVNSIAALINISAFHLVNQSFVAKLINQPTLTSLSFTLGVLAGLFVNWLGAKYLIFISIKVSVR